MNNNDTVQNDGQIESAITQKISHQLMLMLYLNESIAKGIPSYNGVLIV